MKGARLRLFRSLEIQFEPDPFNSPVRVRGRWHAVLRRHLIRVSATLAAGVAEVAGVDVGAGLRCTRFYAVSCVRISARLQTGASARRRIAAGGKAGVKGGERKGVKGARLRLFCSLEIQFEPDPFNSL